jgi:serine phosphatase RsbU (regulator of sigma subunit)
MKRSRPLFFLFLFFSFCTFSQKTNLDSLYKTIESSPDSSKAKKLNGIARTIGPNLPDSAFRLADRARIISERIGFKAGAAKAYFIMGFTTGFTGKNDKVMEYYTRSLALYEELKMKDDIANIYNGMANNYLLHGVKDEAEKCYNKAMDLARQKPESKYYIGILSVGLAHLRSDDKKLDEATRLYEQALNCFREIKNPTYVAMAMINLSGIYMQQNKFAEAKKMNDELIPILEESQDQYALSVAYGSKATILKSEGKIKEAIAYLNKAYDITKRMDNVAGMGSNVHELYEIYKEQKDYKTAIDYLELFMTHKDTLSQRDMTQSYIEAETKFTTDQKEKEIQLKNLQLDKVELEGKRKDHLLYVFIGSSVIFIFFLFVLFRQNAQKKKTNAQLVEQKLAMEKQNALIEEKNKDITDSINYSKHIQQAIIPSPKKVSQLLGESFVIFKPKDIVSGDFYLVEDHVQMIYVAAVDCTGHGVPGAMLSVFADSTIKNSIATNNFRNHPGALLSDLCFQFKSNLQSHNPGTSVNDGVDMSLCIIDKREKKIYFSGARNGLIKVSGGQMTEYHASRWGISGTNKGPQMFFEDHIIDFKEGDWFYIYTDGYADQFGGPKGKKFKHKKMLDLMLENHKLSGSEQKDILENSYESWKGPLEQIDDVTLIGFKL